MDIVEASAGMSQHNSSSCATEADAAAAPGGKNKTMSFFRSRLYKAKSLGSLVKERILVEASHCQYEIWKRFGRKSDVNQNSGSVPSTKLNFKQCMPGIKHRISNECPKMVESSVSLLHNGPQHCSSC